MTPKLSPRQLTWNTYLREAYNRGCAFVPAPVMEIEPLWLKSDHRSGIVSGLDRYFSESPLRPDFDKVSSSLDALGREGYLIPLDLLDKPLVEWQPFLKQLEDFHRRFDWNRYLASVQQWMRYPDLTGKPPGLIALLQFIPPYVEMIGASRGAPSVLLRLSNGRLLSEMLGIEQLMELLLMCVRVTTGKHESIQDVTLMSASASPRIQAFLNVHLSQLMEAVWSVLRGTKFDLKDVQDDFTELFYACGEADLEDLRLAQLAAGRDLTYLPAPLRLALGQALDTQSPQASVFQRIAAFDPSTAPATAPPSPDHTVARDRPLERLALIRNLEPEDRAALLKHTATNAKLTAAARDFYAGQLTDLLNHLCAPTQTWVAIDGRSVPLFMHKQPHEQADLVDRFQQFSAARTLETKETVVLRNNRKLLASARDEPTLDNLAEKARFRSPEMQQRYASALEKRRHELRQLDRYRENKAAEYGMDDYDRSEFADNMFLDEILRIEKEVTPYIPYVREAFRAALPIKTTVEFDTNRHTIDGPEFDPDTLVLPDKYLRGEVMKTFRDTERTIPIEQVNAFCLDYSQSMTHYPMRNLFKLLFLLVLGLEDRQTHDAIYFFGDEFMEVVDFGDEHEGRAVLWTIMQTVTRQNGAQLRYGGKGYTNISNGVEESHERINFFAEWLASSRPGIHLVRSLFMLTDGEPNAGIWQKDVLRDFIQEKREDGDVAIKGIFLNTGEDVGSTVSYIFGPQHTVETNTFESAVYTFVSIMAATYKQQRKAYRNKAKEQQSATL